MKIKFNETTNEYESDTPPQSAEMEQSGIGASLNKIANFDVIGIPIGGAVIGGLGAILVDRVILERIDPTHKYTPYTLLGASALVGKFGRKYVGDAAKYLALILAYEGVSDYISNMVDQVMPPKPPNGNGAALSRAAQPRGASVAQVGSPAAGDYYAQAFRRN